MTHPDLHSGDYVKFNGQRRFARVEDAGPDHLILREVLRLNAGQPTLLAATTLLAPPTEPLELVIRAANVAWPAEIQTPDAPEHRQLN